MAQSHSVACPACGASLKVTKESLIGKKVPCPSCKNPFVIQGPPAAATAEYIPLADDPPLFSAAPKGDASARSGSVKTSAESGSMKLAATEPDNIPLLPDEPTRRGASANSDSGRGDAGSVDSGGDRPKKSKKPASEPEAPAREGRKGASENTRTDSKGGKFASKAESTEFDLMLADSSGTDLDDDDAKPRPSTRRGKSSKRSAADVDTSEVGSVLNDTDEQDESGPANVPTIRRKRSKTGTEVDGIPVARADHDDDDDDYLPPPPARARSRGGWMVAERGPVVVWTSVGAGVLVLLLLYIFFSSRPTSVPALPPAQPVANENESDANSSQVAESDKKEKPDAAENADTPGNGTSLLRHKDKDKANTGKANADKPSKADKKGDSSSGGTSEDADAAPQKSGGMLKPDAAPADAGEEGGKTETGSLGRKELSPRAKNSVDAKTALAMAGAGHKGTSGAGEVGLAIPPFSAAAVDSTTYHSADHKDQVLVVAFLGVECPLANLYAPSLAALARHYHGKSVAVIAVNSNAQDTLEETRAQARTSGLTFPVLKDAGNAVADLFGAERTPEIFVLDAQRTIRYRGMLDDQFGYRERRSKPTRTYVIAAVDALLKAEAVPVAQTPVQGCHIGRVTRPSETAKSSYYRDVLPILQRRCQQCHRKGEIGPFALSDYEVVRDWGSTIRDAVSERRMPPWPADRKIGTFQNDISLSDQEISLITQWVEEGCPQGDSAEKPPAKEFVDGWNIGKPDKVFTMAQPYHVPATGVIEYQKFIVSQVFTKDTWVQGVECRFGNRSVVHHMLVLLDFPKDKARSQDGLIKGFLAAGAPGNTYFVFPPGYAKKIPKGARLRFQMHYTPNGTPTDDVSKFGIVLAKGESFREVQTFALGKPDITIPAGDANHKEWASQPVPMDVTLTALIPHLHVRGKSFEFFVQRPNGEKEPLLSVPRWDFNWQYQYELAEPLVVPKGSQLIVEAHWDNSANNPNNIFPLVDAHFGEQTFDEMFIGYINAIPSKTAPDAAGHPGRGVRLRKRI
jgi:peroxiredoxin